MPERAARPELVACCGLYCGACRAHLKGKCPGCHYNDRAGWCKVRSCCTEKGIASCADCATHADVNECRKFNHFIARLFGLVFRSDRAACIAQIRTLGIDGHARAMAGKGQQAIRRK